MLQAYVVSGGKLVPTPLEEGVRPVWIDLFNPSEESMRTAEVAVPHIEVPTRDEMEEIELSSRLYVYQGAIYLTAVLPTKADTDQPELVPITFVLSGQQLVTIRFHEPKALMTFAQRTQFTTIACNDGEDILIGLLESIIEHLADHLERVGREIDLVGRVIFNKAVGHSSKRNDELLSVLHQIGAKEEFASRMRESLTTLVRLPPFLLVQPGRSKENKGRLKSVSRDMDALVRHADFLSQKVAFLLDATLGMIGVEQNAIIKIVSVAAVVFLPPTLVASIYGMNFDIMPELKWALGYPMALGMMAVAAILPYLYFKKKGWL
ncbi:magnesium transporter CorA family protein [Limoniibacter endophyticus]|uniref:Magnesium transport protein CorA n=1 Tax=Limoniibacter endophyticus TaxID=1565040 RepID=A0A8J3GGI3_9HYPH|nr:magnesium transporter CorA family protein [Limoniibacter endophyticus]GHC65608.1 magnesium transport protein CorA [Limoniibacter endophyticus]